MGCFSYLCKSCGRPINANSFSGHRCTLFLLEEGKVIEKMVGQYNSYGAVFNDKKESVEWKSYPWSMSKGKTICDLHFDNDKSNGIAAYHERCCPKKKLPTTRSEDDPEQGWGRHKQQYDFSHEHEVYEKNS